MVTTVSTDLAQELEAQQAISQPQPMQWHYSVPCPGVRYYGYWPAPSPAQDSDPWSPDLWSLKDILSPPDVDQD